MINNDLTSYFAFWANNDTNLVFYTISGQPYPSTNIYNNTIEEGKGAHSPNSTTPDTALIIKNVPYTDINNIQSLILYNRTEGGSFFG